MRSTEVIKTLAEHPERKSEYLLVFVDGRILMRQKLSEQYHNILRRFPDADYAIMSKEDLEFVSWKHS